MKNIYKLLFAISMLPGLLLTGCPKKKNPNAPKPGAKGDPSRSNGATRGGSSTTSDPANRAEAQGHSALNARIKKQQEYLQSLGSVSKPIHRAFERYSDWCEGDCWKHGPTGKEQHISYGIFDIDNDPKDTLAKIRETAKSSPSFGKADEAALKYADAVETLYPVIRSAHLYYEHEDYKTDGGAKGRELHKTLVEQYKLMNDAYQPFKEVIDEIEEEMTKQELATYDKNSIHYMAIEFLMISKEFVQLLEKVDWKAPQTAPDNQKAIQQANLLIEKWKAMDTVVTLNTEKLKAETGSSYFRMTSSSREMKSQASQMIERLNKPPKDRISSYEKSELKKGAAEKIQGLWPAAMRAYNRLVDEYNGSKFKE